MILSIGQSFSRLSAITYHAFFDAIHHTSTATRQQVLNKSGKKEMDEIFDVSYPYMKRRETHRCEDIHSYEHTYICIYI